VKTGKLLHPDKNCEVLLFVNYSKMYTIKEIMTSERTAVVKTVLEQDDTDSLKSPVTLCLYDKKVHLDFDFLSYECFTLKHFFVTSHLKNSTQSDRI